LARLSKLIRRAHKRFQVLIPSLRNLPGATDVERQGIRTLGDPVDEIVIRLLKEQLVLSRAIGFPRLMYAAGSSAT
jgi:hypothetical protein